MVSDHPTDPVAMSRAVLQRRADAALSLLPPVRPTPKLPSQDPSFVRLTGRVKSSAKSLKAHPPARHEVKKAQDAAQPPANDVASQAKAAQVDEMGTAKPGTFDKARFMAAVRAAIAKAAPKDMKEAEEFSSSGKADATKTEVMSQVGQGKAQSAGDIKGKAAQPPDPSKGVSKPVTPMGQEAEVAQPGDPGAAAAMPKPAPPEQTNLAAPKAAVDGQMSAAGVTEEQLARSNEPAFQGALASKKAGEAHSAAAPAAFRAEEAPLLAGARGGAAQAAHGALAEMTGVKKRALGGVGADKSGAKAKDEVARQQVAAQIESIYAGTKADTEGILTNLDGKVDSAFEAGEREAKAAFEDYHTTRVRKWKMDNYVIPIGGLARWVLDQLSSPSPELLRIFSEARAAYTRRMESVISNIADMIGTELGRARARIAQGKAQIKEFVEKQKGDLRKFAQEAETGISGKFDELTSSVDDKQESMVDTLAEKYVTAKQNIDARVTALQDENKGLWDQATAAIGGAIETILKLKDMLLGILSRAAGAVERIVADPIAFLCRLITGVQAGLKQFVGNIAGHLKKGLQGWLFGALSAGGIEVPEKFDLKGIFGMVTSILGLTWANFRDRLTKKVGPAIAGKIEQSLDFVKAIATEGIGGAWKWVVGKLTELKDQVMGQIRTFVMEKVVMAGVTWLISLLNPASAFVKACKMIYDAIMWFVDNGQQVKELVESILDSTEAILAGAYSTVANKIEGALAKVLPMAISFLASLLGLGGLSEKIKAIIEKIQKPVNDVIDKLIDRAAGFGKRLFSKMKNSKLGKKVTAGIGAGKRAYARGKAYVKEKWEAGKAYVAGKASAVADAICGFVRPFSMAGEPHKLIVEPGSRTLLMASVPTPVLVNISNEMMRVQELIDAGRAERRQMLALEGMDRTARQIEDAIAKYGPDHPMVDGGVKLLQNEMHEYGDTFEVRGFGKKGWNAVPRPGETAPWGDQPRGGGRAFEREHVIPSSVVAALIGMKRGETPEFKRVDTRMPTIIWERRAADLKTVGPLSGHKRDRDAINDAKREIASGTFSLSTFVGERIAASIAARDQAGLTEPTNDEIVGAANKQLSSINALLAEAQQKQRNG